MSAAVVPLGLCAQQARGLGSSTCQSESLGPCSQKLVGWVWVWGGECRSPPEPLLLPSGNVFCEPVDPWAPPCPALGTHAHPGCSSAQRDCHGLVLPGGLVPRCGKSSLHGGSSQCKANVRPCSVLSEAWFSLLLQRECWLLCEMGTM